MTPQTNTLLSFHEQMLLRAYIGGEAFVSTENMLSNLHSHHKLQLSAIDICKNVETHRLITLRRKMLADALERGDHDEVQRLESLALFDTIAAADSESPIDSKPAAPSQCDHTIKRSESGYMPLEFSHEQFSHSIKASAGILKGNFLAKGLEEEAKTFFTLMSTPSTSAKPSSPSSPGYLNNDLVDPAVKAAYEVILTLSKSPLIINLLSDMMLLAEHEAGLYEPGLPEIESMRERIEVAMEIKEVKEFERASDVVGAWQDEERARRQARLDDDARKLDKDEGVTKSSEGEERRGHIAWWDGYSAPAAAKQEDKTPDKTVRASRFREML